ncbi:type III secretion system chaperone [Erwinia amylovora]|uniref:Potential ORFB-specific chaperone n=3 Tax=Erwinia amylovora TaxID=552 RepID=A0A831A175_ERWAM|nr:type III secretion system chaperone [Erwinia amylovora]CDK14152.1 putative ORFB-specific chaperone [Erwinia amylovora LA635]CDK17519.1 putative ORFB-specific chaperone [Erwinia amylovora LA636]CDK20888.1 putative ORFB-specific chaperone [Erwinia amylovora LA637]AAF63396.2 potential ORFB-specific chaperone [Erwinia amylovora]AEH03405.1 OrfA [Erwinia amylovora]
MIIQDLLGGLARRLEAGPLSLDASQLCCLQVNGLEMTLEWLEQQNMLFVYLNIGTLAGEQHGALLADILAANLFHYGASDGAAFGLDKEKNELLLFQRFQLPSVDEASFVSACVQMIEVAKIWQGKLLHGRAVPSVAPRMLAQQGLTLNLAGKIT